MLKKVNGIEQPFVDYGERFGVCFINYEGGKLPILAPGVILNGLVDCIGQITIEKDAFFGHDCMLLTGSHDYNYFGEERKRYGVNGSIYIQEGAWIGSRAIILGKPGTTVIGKHSVIGAGTVISKSVPEYEMWVGNPARCVKRYNQTIKQWEKVKVVLDM